MKTGQSGVPVGSHGTAFLYVLVEVGGLTEDDLFFLGFQGEGEFEEQVHDFFGGQIFEFSFFEFGEEGFDPAAEDLDAFVAMDEVLFPQGLGVDGLEVLNLDSVLLAEGNEGGLADLEFISDFGVGQALGAELDKLVFYGLVDGHFYFPLF
jgi:hypothetical protein